MGLIGEGHQHTYDAEIHMPYRYPDGCCLSRHPKSPELYAHYAFWQAQLNAEQMKVLDAMRDIQVMRQYRAGPPKLLKRTPEEAVEWAIKIWSYYYPQEVKDFLLYGQIMRERRLNKGGYDVNKIFKLRGAIPPVINHMLKLYHPEMIMTIEGDRYAKGHELFFKLFEKARIADQ